MSIGMTYEQYWYGDVHMVRAFYEAEKLRRQTMDEMAWLHGLYTYKALAATVGNIGNKGKSIEYPREPIYKPELSDRLSKEKREQEEVDAAKAWMSQLVSVGKNWGNKDKGVC
jgi:hypothetical protein